MAPAAQRRRRCALSARRARRFPDVPHVAVFDTAFHATMPDEAARLRRARARGASEWDVRRHGFHGLSVEWAARAGAGASSARRRSRLVVCHLGGGASATAVRDGRSVDTSMGFSPLEGLVMATRVGLARPRHPPAPDPPRAGSAGRGGAAPAQRGERAARRWRAPPTCARWRRAAAAGDAAARRALAVHDHRLAATVAAHDRVARRPRRAGLHRRRRRGLGPRPRGGRAARLAFLGRRGRPRAQHRGRRATPTCRPRGAAVRTLVVHAREEVVIARAARPSSPRRRVTPATRSPDRRRAAPARRRTGGRPTTCRSGRSTCSTTRCCASRCASSTSSRGCWATGAPRPGSTSSTPT